MAKNTKHWLQRAVIVEEDDGSKYLIPYNLKKHFQKRLEKCWDSHPLDPETNEYGWEEFDEEWGDYKIKGDYEIYAKFKTK